LCRLIKTARGEFGRIGITIPTCKSDVCMCLLFVAIERGLVKEIMTTYELNLKCMCVSSAICVIMCLWCRSLNYAVTNGDIACRCAGMRAVY
jgi:hypothetical protein